MKRRPTQPKDPIMANYRYERGIDLPEGELDRRLAESRCVWCGIELYPGKSPDDMFCTEAHHLHWQQATHANYDSGGTPVDRSGMWQEDDRDETPPSWLGTADTSRRTEPIAVTQADLDAMPAPPLTDVPDLQLDHVPDRTRIPDDDLPALIDAAIRGRATRWDAEMVARLFNVPIDLMRPPQDPEPIGLPPELDYVLGQGIYWSERRQDTRPGIIATPQTPRPTAQGFTLGGLPWCEGSRYVVEEIGPEPEPETAWPADDLRAWQQHGWTTDVPDALRTCPRCEHTDRPTQVEARFPEGHSQSAVTAVTFRRQTKLCCGHCRLPYPGPTLVPLHRAHPTLNAQDYALLGTRGHMVRTIPDAALALSVPGVLVGRVWEELYRGVALALSMWGCCHPGCGGRAHHWVVLATALAWDGWLWEPHDGVPLRMGLCPAHWYGLQREVYTSEDIALRHGQWLTDDHDMARLVIG